MIKRKTKKEFEYRPVFIPDLILNEEVINEIQNDIQDDISLMRNIARKKIKPTISKTKRNILDYISQKERDVTPIRNCEIAATLATSIIVGLTTKSVKKAILSALLIEGVKYSTLIPLNINQFYYDKSISKYKGLSKGDIGIPITNIQQNNTTAEQPTNRHKQKKDIVIMHISDIHGCIKNDIYRVVRKYKPDLIIDTGDTIDETTNIHQYRKIRKFYKAFADKIIRVDGNHDNKSLFYGDFLDICNKYNINILDTKSNLVYNFDGITITGNPEVKSDIFIAHMPDSVDKLKHENPIYIGRTYTWNADKITNI